MKGHLYFPKLFFRNAKSVEKQRSYGARSSEYYWLAKNHEKYDFEYYEILKVTSYCHFEFSTFPFDTHECDLVVGSALLSENQLRIAKPTITYNKTKSSQNVTIISKNVPFEMSAKSIAPFLIEMKNNYYYSHSGLRISFKRNNLGLLMGGFYGPTAAFSAVSLLSYNINIDMVHNTVRSKVILTIILN